MSCRLYRLPNGAVPAAFFTKALFRPDGRFGAFGAPTDVRAPTERVWEAARDGDLEVVRGWLAAGGGGVA